LTSPSQLREVVLAMVLIEYMNHAGFRVIVWKLFVLPYD
jgi:hypothetical protein